MRDALADHGGIIRQAARSLDTNSVTFARRAKRYGLVPGLTLRLPLIGIPISLLGYRVVSVYPSGITFRQTQAKD